jgi:epsilon-lactone hydrolase
MSTTVPREPERRTGAMTPAERRAANAPALAPGGPPSLRARAFNQVLKVMLKSPWRRSPDSDAGLIQVRRAAERSSRFQTIPRGVTFEPQNLADCTAEWVRVRTDAGAGANTRSGASTDADADTGAGADAGTGADADTGTDVSGAGAGVPGGRRRVVLYLHGGGYFFGGPRLYRPFTWRLAAAMRRPVLALDYRLAPEHTPADALGDALAAYEFLLGEGYEPADIVVGGDSAGGHLTLALLLALKERERPLPRAAIVLSPWADLLCTAESHTLNARTDCLIPAEKLAWLGRRFCEGTQEGTETGAEEGTETGVADGAALHAPVRGDYAGLPPLLVISSDSEILRDDARQVAERARAAGVQVEHQEWRGLAHVFAIFADFMPEGKAAFGHMAEFVRGVEVSEASEASAESPVES